MSYARLLVKQPRGYASGCSLMGSFSPLSQSHAIKHVSDFWKGFNRYVVLTRLSPWLTRVCLIQESALFSKSGKPDERLPFTNRRLSSSVALTTR